MGQPVARETRSARANSFSDNSGALLNDAAEMRRRQFITTVLAGLVLAQSGAAWAHDRGGRNGRPDWARWEVRDDGSRDDRRQDDRRRPPYPALRDDGPPPGAQRGGYLPDRYRGGFVEDYQRFRLRPPPRGYAWVRVNGGFALVSIEDGRIFDVIPD